MCFVGEDPWVLRAKCVIGVSFHGICRRPSGNSKSSVVWGRVLEKGHQFATLLTG
jgi:hypothetical protein